MPLRVGSLFSGIGGFDLAARRVGMTVAWQSEIEPYACRVLAHRFPGVPNLGDVTRIEDAPCVDVVTFGSPCQDLSVAGKRAGLAGERSGLFHEAIRLITRIRPRFAVWENVPGALSSAGGRDFGQVLDALSDAGALDIAWRVLDAQWFGVPQRRRRVFVVCDFAGERAASVLFEPPSSPGYSAASQETGAGATTGAPDGAGVFSLQLANGNASVDHWDDLAPTLRRHPSGKQDVAIARALTSHPDDQDGTADTYVPFVADLAQITSQANGSRVIPGGESPTLAAGSQMVTASALSASAGHHGHSSPRGDGSDNLIVAIESGQGWWNEDVAPLRAEGDRPSRPSHAVAGEFGVRRLTPVECERLQGFPDGWTCLEGHAQPCECPDAPRYRALGNAVAVPVVEWLLRRIATVVD